jgi:AraC family transcriptional regulator, melibiose operon regulatory protein
MLLYLYTTGDTMINLDLMKDSSEILHYNNPAIPLYIRKERIFSYSHLSGLCHWHDDIEYIGMRKGHMAYNVNGKKIMIHEHDGLLINSRQMHYGYSDDGTDNEFYCVVFKPQLIAANLELQHKYIEPVIENITIPYYYLSAAEEPQKKIMTIFDRIIRLNENQATGFELVILSELQIFWTEWFKLLKPYSELQGKKIDRDIAVQKQMVRFIYTNYMSRITLDDIAAAGSVCRSSCCRIFRRYFNKTPNDFLNSYRLEVSMNLLLDTTRNITDISYSCGFNSPSYYTEIFSQYKGCSPTEFRTQRSLLLTRGTGSSW